VKVISLGLGKYSCIVGNGSGKIKTMSDEGSLSLDCMVIMKSFRKSHSVSYSSNGSLKGFRLARISIN
jgi:hypothetical protein